MSVEILSVSGKTRPQYSKQFVPEITKRHVNVLNTVGSYFPDIDKT